MVSATGYPQAKYEVPQNVATIRMQMLETPLCPNHILWGVGTPTSTRDHDTTIQCAFGVVGMGVDVTQQSLEGKSASEQPFLRSDMLIPHFKGLVWSVPVRCGVEFGCCELTQEGR